MGKCNLRCIPTRTRKGGGKSYDGGCLLDLVVSFSRFPPRVPIARCWLGLKLEAAAAPDMGAGIASRLRIIGQRDSDRICISLSGT